MHTNHLLSGNRVPLCPRRVSSTSVLPPVGAMLEQRGSSRERNMFGNPFTFGQPLSFARFSSPEPLPRTRRSLSPLSRSDPGSTASEGSRSLPRVSASSFSITPRSRPRSSQPDAAPSSLSRSHPHPPRSPCFFSGPSFSVSGKPRQPLSDASASPSPASYSLSHLSRSSNTAPSFSLQSKARSNFHAPADTSVPGPHYAPAQRNDGPAFSLQGKCHSSDRASDSGELGYATPSSFGKGPTMSFSAAASRSRNTRNDDTPGAGEYETHPQSRSSGPAFSIAGRASASYAPNEDDDDSPAPGEYSELAWVGQDGPAFSLRASKRDYIQTSSRAPTIGPQSEHSVFGNQACSFSFSGKSKEKVKSKHDNTSTMLGHRPISDSNTSLKITQRLHHQDHKEHDAEPGPELAHPKEIGNGIAATISGRAPDGRHDADAPGPELMWRSSFDGPAASFGTRPKIKAGDMDECISAGPGEYEVMPRMDGPHHSIAGKVVSRDATEDDFNDAFIAHGELSDGPAFSLAPALPSLRGEGAEDAGPSRTHSSPGAGCASTSISGKRGERLAREVEDAAPHYCGPGTHLGGPAFSLSGRTQ
jgi:hypothetical protein